MTSLPSSPRIAEFVAKSKVTNSRPHGPQDSGRGAFPGARGGPNMRYAMRVLRNSLNRSTSSQSRRGNWCLQFSVIFGIMLGAMVTSYASTLTVKRLRESSLRREPPREGRGIHASGDAVNNLGLDGAPSGVSTVQPVSTHQGLYMNSTLVVDQPPLSSYPSPKVSTVLFLHIYKCAGTTLREVFTTWAIAEGYYGSVVQECNKVDSLKEADKVRLGLKLPLEGRGDVCLNNNNELRDPERQGAYIMTQKALAGHFHWGFQDYVNQPHLMVTTLRNPLELMVSAQQQMHRKETKTLKQCTSWVDAIMKKRLKEFKRYGLEDMGFIWRLVDQGVTGKPSGALPSDKVQKFGLNAAENLSTFWLVGVVEQYKGFLAVLQRVLDPGKGHPSIWTAAHARRNNSSPVGSKDVLQRIDPNLTREFNATLQLQWEVYSVALYLWDRRCREVVKDDEYEELCSVPPVPTSYAPSSEEP